MSGMGVELYVRRIGDGDKGELFYELKEALMKSLWAKCKRTTTQEMRSYLNQEDVHIFMSDRAHDHGDPNSVLFAFWDEDGTAQELAVHGFEIMMALDAKRLDKLCRARGHSVVFEKHALEPLLTYSTTPYFRYGGTQHNRVTLWRRDVPVENAPTTRHDLAGWGPSDVAGIKAIGMTGWCSCDICQVVRKRKKIEEPKLDETVLRAWSLLAEPRGGELIAVRDDPAFTALGDWLEERGAAISRQLLPGLAKTYGR